MQLFDELRDPNLKLPNGLPPPPLFDFKPHELFEHPPSIKQRLIPEWFRQKQAETRDAPACRTTPTLRATSARSGWTS